MNQRRKQIKSTKRLNIRHKKRIENRNYRIFIGFIIFYLLFTLILEYETIGGNINYFYFIILLPTLIGVYLSTKYFFLNDVWKEIITDSKNNSLISTILEIFVFFVGNLVLSFLVFATVPQVIWNYSNYYETKNHVSEVYIADISGISTSTNKASPKFHFKFKGQSESVKASFEYVTAHEDFEKYQIKLLIKKGIWDAYYVEDWNIISK
jgi:hypothetical protein